MTAFRGALVVVKVGGDVLLDERQRVGLGQNIKDLVDDGCQVVVLHGGGPQVTTLQEQVGLKATKIAGRRVTSVKDLVVVVQAICGEVNVGLVSALVAAGVRAFGCHGASGQLVTAQKRAPMQVQGIADPVDYGEVGDVVAVDAGLLRSLLGLGVVPVVGTLGIDARGRVFNINADTTAVQIARALSADLLLMVTAVGGVFQNLHDPSTRIASLTPAQAQTLIVDGTIAGGMIPKVEEALSILDEGVGAVAIMGAHQPGSFRSALSGDGGSGTRFSR